MSVQSQGPRLLRASCKVTMAYYENAVVLLHCKRFSRESVVGVQTRASRFVLVIQIHNMRGI